MKLSSIDVVYFSPTGGCEKLAYYGAPLLSDAATRLHNITQLLPRETFSLDPSSELLILIFPVYAQDMPSLIKAFINKLQPRAIPAIILTVYGNVSPGRALYHASMLLKTKGFLLIGAGEFVGAHSYNHNKLHIAPQEPSQKQLLSLTELLNGVLCKLAHSASYKACEIQLSKSIKNPFAFLPERLLSSLAASTPKHFSDRCIRCNVCQIHCPTHAIHKDYSIDSSQCIRCFSCVKRCPKQTYTLSIRTPFTLLYLKCFEKELKAPQIYF